MSGLRVDRRTFIATSAGAVAAAALGGTDSVAQAQELPAISGHKPMTRVNCFSEDGELKEVGFGTLDGFVLPDYDPVYDFAGKKITALLKKAGGKTFEEAAPEWAKEVKDNMETVVDFLEGRGITVHRPRPNTETELANFAVTSKLNHNIYNRDSLVAVGNTLVETSFMTPTRIRNKYAMRYLSMGLMRKGNKVISMPQPLDTFDHNMDEEPLAEGGDVMLDHGNNIYIGNSGQASNSLGVEWFRNAFPDWKVHEIKISDKSYPHQHLDCVMVAFSRWGCILLDDIVGGFDGLPEPLKNKQWIALKPEEAHAKLGNFIAINPEEVVMPLEAERLRKEVEALRPRIKVHAFEYGEVGQIGGSLRCNTSPVYRVG